MISKRTTKLIISLYAVWIYSATCILTYSFISFGYLPNKPNGIKLSDCCYRKQRWPNFIFVSYSTIKKNIDLALLLCESRMTKYCIFIRSHSGCSESIVTINSKIDANRKQSTSSLANGHYIPGKDKEV